MCQFDTNVIRGVERSVISENSRLICGKKCFCKIGILIMVTLKEGTHKEVTLKEGDIRMYKDDISAKG